MIAPVGGDDRGTVRARPDQPDRSIGILHGPRVVVAELLAATALMTRLPVPHLAGARSGAAALAAIGAVVGLAGFVPLVALGVAVAPIAAILAVSTIVILTGAIHLDGLADTADALVAMGPDGAERARKDPAVGVGGVTALILVLGLETVSLWLLGVESTPLIAGLACVVAGSVSRAVPVVLVVIARHRAGATGLGGWFASQVTARDAAAATLTTGLVCAAAAGLSGTAGLVAAGVAGGIGGVVVGLALIRARGQLDGDLLGASVELAFVVVLVIAATAGVGTTS